MLPVVEFNVNTASIHVCGLLKINDPMWCLNRHSSFFELFGVMSG